MPFTFSHPAAILPLINNKWKKLSATGLIVGSIIPDFESFIMLSKDKQYSHTFWGIFWYDLPLAVLVSFLFHDVVRNRFIQNLPSVLSAKLEQYLQFNWNYFFVKHFLLILISFCIGIFSHLIWDFLTHFYLSNIDDYDLPMYSNRLSFYNIFQIANSIVGMTICILYLHNIKLPSVPTLGNVRSQSEKVFYWFLLFSTASFSFYLMTLFYKAQIGIIVLIDMLISATLVSFIVTPIEMALIDKLKYISKKNK